MKNQHVGEIEDLYEQKEMVFVLGAGASVEVGLPAGNGLKNKIADLLDFNNQDKFQPKFGDQAIFESFIRVSHENPNENLRKMIAAAASIRNAMPQALSIDNFLDAHSGNEYIEIAAKLAITRAILNAEAKSSLYIKNQEAPMNFGILESTWFNRFFQSLSENCKFYDLKKRLRKITVISFNYDRCFKHFMRHAIQNYYCVDKISAYDAVSQIEVLYPYGSTGNFSTPEEAGIDFGADLSALKLLEVSKQIKTFTEQIDENSKELKRIRSCLGQTKKIIFLGFAYHPLNMDLLFPKDHSVSYECDVFGTAFCIPPYDVQIIRDNMTQRLMNSQIVLDPVSCYDLYNSRWRALSMTK